ncbi:MAG TPA: homocysteine S-methyltransferase family protein [Myxococcota bacterium]|jgi:S-methylmethionine-dependent homocysteine/selenocysteine methylase
MGGIPEPLGERLRRERPVLLDGATGTELERRGVATRLPLWSAAALIGAPALVERIHRDYAKAGAEALTANTFRTQRRTLAREGLGERAAELTALAVRLAREAAASSASRPLVLGSDPPLEDCYRPDLVPDESALASEHAEHCRNLAEAGVDAILCETHNSLREACAAARAASETGLPVLVSFVCWEGATLLSGERLADAVQVVRELRPAALLVNCLPPSNAMACLAVLASAGLPFGVYANLGAPDDATGFRRSRSVSPRQFAAAAAEWVAAGARLVGGCCGTTPAHIAAIRRSLRS